MELAKICVSKMVYWLLVSLMREFSNKQTNKSKVENEYSMCLVYSTYCVCVWANQFFHGKNQLSSYMDKPLRYGQTITYGQTSLCMSKLIYSKFMCGQTSLCMGKPIMYRQTSLYKNQFVYG